METQGEKAIELKPGSQVAARYRIERVIAERNGGALLATHNLESGGLVALKVFPRSAGEGQIISRFRRAQNIESAHVPQLFELGAVGDGRTFVAMEYLAGETIEHRLGRNPLPIADALSVLLQVCDAVAAAHRAGVVHRRLRAAKLFEAQLAGGTTQIRVLGFATGLPADALKPGELPDDLDTLAPEQLSGINNGDRAADIWALGIIGYELLSGKRPFSGLTRKALARAITEDNPKLLRSVRPEVPWQLEQVVLRCLDKTPASRIESAEDLLKALEPFATASPLTTVEGTLLSSSTIPPARSTAPVRGSMPPRTGVDGPGRSNPPQSLVSPDAIQVAKLSHLLGGESSTSSRDSTPAFHRFGSDGKLRGMKVDDVVDLARARRISGEAARLKEDDARRRESVAPPSVAPRPSGAPLARSVPPTSMPPARSAPPSARGVSTATIVVAFIVVAALLGLGVGLLVQSLM